MNNQNDNAGSTIKSQPVMQWFERKFDLGLGTEQFGGLLDRLAQFPAVLRQALEVCPATVTTIKADMKWSVNEHVGHLFLLESLWRKRFQDIKDSLEKMSPADLNNRATDEASFNDYQARDLIERFMQKGKRPGYCCEALARRIYRNKASIRG